MKKSFLLHLDSLSILDEMTDEQAGIFVKSMYYYQKNNCLPEIDFAMKMAITPFINQFIRDIEKWKSVAERNKHNGSKGGRPKTQITQTNPNNPVGYSITQITQTNPEKPRKAVSVNVNVNDSVNVNIKNNQKEIIFCFNDFSENEITSIKNWLEYKSDKKESYKSQHGYTALRNELLKLKKSQSIIECINFAMAKNWKGIFAINDAPLRKNKFIADSIAHCNSQDYTDMGDFK